MQRARTWLAGLMLASLFSPALADTVEIKGARFAERVQLDGQRFIRIGQGLFEYWIWDAYAGAYYQGEGFPRPAPQSAAPRRLELEYFHAIEAEGFAEVTRDRVRQALGESEFAALASSLADFNAAYRDVVPGDRYALTWRDGRLTLALNGETLYVGEELDLANALFGIWLGEKPLSEDFRDALLGQR